MRRGAVWLGITAALLGAAWVGARIAYPLPSTAGRAPVSSIPFAPDSTFGPAARRAAEAHPGMSGIIALAEGEDALKSRLDLIALAEHSIDALYYIWHEDASGLLLLDALREAALRGVRVRLLLDDNGIEQRMDPLLGALDALPGFEVRIFNPSTIRRVKWAGYLLNPVRINRRMHNKALIVDGAAAIVGGRNIGDEYFSLGDGIEYFDLDVLGVGQVVPDTAAVFDAYWNARAAIDIAELRGFPAPDAERLEAEVMLARGSERARAVAGLPSSPPVLLARGGPPLEWARVEVLADPPGKVLGDAADNTFLFKRLSEILMAAEDRLDIVSSYFVPGPRGSRILEGIEASGRQVRILTNSFLATDVPLVHAGYVKRRDDLLRAGVEIFEVLPGGGAPSGREEMGRLGLSGTSLHAKSFAVDGQQLFAGSFNFDPRSVALNCEMGFLIDSPALAQASSAQFGGAMVRHSLRPVLRDGRTVWQETAADGSVTVHRVEPGTSLGSRLAMTVLGWLPIEWLL
ncbi:phospholipase D family protein [Paracoccus sp. S-4012]|uniref:phospholipase D family protein n=1 Tax=Paracoccus sp. S-4012 TaxID=2665648 RepID=UPI0012AFF5D6|nr:phospholipase D family protein [Paracoccus sp. S-4012]MRX49033.1 phospholipase D family protein [Paracoccus sp. S-4012]